TTAGGDISLNAGVTGAGLSLTFDTSGNAAGDANATTVSVGALTLQNLGGTASFTGSVTASTLTVLSSVKNVSFTGGLSITGTTGTTFQNSGTLTLGDGLSGNDTYTFGGALTALSPASVNLGGTISTLNNAAISLGDVDPPVNLAAGANAVQVTGGAADAAILFGGVV